MREPTARDSCRLSTLRELRAERGVSLRELGAATGISNGLLFLMERGLLIPNSTQLGLIVDALAPGGEGARAFRDRAGAPSVIRVAGIDVSSLAIDIVTLPLDPELDDGHKAIWTRAWLGGDSGIFRAFDAYDVAPRGTFWDDVAEVAIERPYGPGGDTLFALHLAVGAIVASLPARLRPPLLLAPASWRKHAGVGGRASKADVRRFVVDTYPGIAGWLPQDAYDALCIARAARALNLERLERAA